MSFIVGILLLLALILGSLFIGGIIMGAIFFVILCIAELVRKVVRWE